MSNSIPLLSFITLPKNKILVLIMDSPLCQQKQENHSFNHKDIHDVPLEHGIDLERNTINGTNEKTNPQWTDPEYQKEERDGQYVAHQIQENRTNMTIVHFLLTAPKWSLSLFLFLAARTIPLSSPQVAVQQPIQLLQTTIQVESQSYLHCTMRASDRLQVQLDDLAQEEYDRVQSARQFNLELIARAQTDADACFNATKNARDSLVRWRSDGMNIPFVNDSSQCNSVDREAVSVFLGEEFQLVGNKVSSILDGFVQSTKDSLDRIQNYTQARIQYDVNYFVTSRIEPALSVLGNQSVTVSFQSLFVDEAELKQQIQASLTEVQYTLDQATIRIQTLSSRVSDFSISIGNFYHSYVDIYDRLVRAATFVQGILPPGVPIPAVFDLSSVPLADSLLPPVTSIPKFGEELASTQALLANVTSSFFNIVHNLAQSFEEQATRQLRGSSNEFATQIHSLLDLSNYNPPKFIGSIQGINDISQEVDRISNLGEMALSQTQAALNQLQGVGQISTGALPTIPTITASNFSFSNDATKFDYLSPILPKISIPELFDIILAWLAVNTWVLEIIIQSIRLWSLESKYSRGSVPDLPALDYGTGDQDKEMPSVKRLLFFAFMKTFATPWILLMLIFFPVSVIAVAIWYPYLQGSCHASGQGTYLANNFLAPLLINEANAQGNAFYAKAELGCRQSQRQLCDRLQVDADVHYQADVASFQGIKLQQQQSLEKLGIIGKCVDPVINQQFSEACCGLRGYSGDANCVPQMTSLVCPIDDNLQPPGAFRPLAEYVSETACQQNIQEWELEDSSFNCGLLLESCQLPCTGVNEKLLRSQIIKTDCDVELYVIRCCIFFLLVLYHAIAVNLICTLIFGGIRQVFWRQLCPVGIQFHTQLNEDGDIAKGGDKSERQQRINLALGRFQMLGKLKIALGVAALTAWFASVLVMKARIE